MSDIPKPPKPPSGAQGRKRRREKSEQSRRGGAGPEDFAALGPPDLNDLTKGLVYARNCGLVAMYQIVNSPNEAVDPLTRWKLVKDFILALGTTHVRTAVEDKLNKLTKERKRKADPSGGLDRFDGIARPATARRARPTVEVDADAGHVPGSSEEEDPGDPVDGGRPVGSGGAPVC